MFSPLLKVCIVTGLILSAIGCATSAPSAVYDVVTPAELSIGSPLPDPADDAVLTVSGQIAVKNSGDELRLDIPTIEKLGLVEYTVSDPWFKKDVTYTGVLMSDLTEFIGVPDSATNLHVEALDDYQVDISLAEIQKWPVLLATRTDNQYMTVENSGPTRIIFPYHAYSEIDPVRYNDLWIWNIKSMEFN